MNKAILGLSVFGVLVGNAVGLAQTPPAGYGVMGVPPPNYGAYASAPPPNVPAYPNSMPPSSPAGGVTPPPGYVDPYTTAPPPGQMSSYAPQGTSNYSAPPSSNYGNYGYATGKTGPNMVNFKNLEVFYRYVDPKNSALDGAHTIGAALTLELFDPLYLKFGASWGSGPGGAGNVNGAVNANYDFASIQAGAGFHTKLITDRLTFVGEAGLSYASLRATDSSLSFSDGSVYIRPALRFTPLDWLEIQAGVTVSSADKYDSKILDLSAYFRLLPMFDIGVGADFGDTTRAFRTALRLRW